MNQLELFLFTYGVIVIRYLLIAGLFYFFFYRRLRASLFYKKIQTKFPRRSDVRRELLYSLISIIIFSCTVVLIVKTPIAEYTRVYYSFSDMPLWYYPLCFILMLVVHDTYFYWAHRFMHHPLIFRKVHLLHHKSTNPSPWAAYAFHPIEAVVEASILPILAFCFPIYFLLFGLFFFFSILYNVYGHCGYELLPKRLNTHPIGKWLNTSVHHNMHHEKSQNSYGLYFTFWDRVMGTLAEDYYVQFEEVKARRPMYALCDCSKS